MASWLLGHPQAALAETEHAIKVARETGQSVTLMYVLNYSTWTHIHCGNYAAANALVDEFIALKDQQVVAGGWAMTQRGRILASTGKASEAVQTIPLRPHRNAIIGNNDEDAVVAFASGKSQRGNRSI